PTDRRPRTSRLLSCHRPVGRPPQPCPIVATATSCESLRSTCTPVIAASEGEISAQTDCRVATGPLLGEQLIWALMVVCLQKSRPLCCRSRHLPVAVLEPETMRSTSRACAPQQRARSGTDRHRAGKGASPPQDQKTQRRCCWACRS